MHTGRRLCGTLKAILLCLLAVLLCSCGRGVGRCAGDVTEVTYHNWTGHVVPSWSENYIISGTSVRLTRTGEPGAEVNAGAWEFDVDPQDVALLFAQLKAVKWSSIKAIPPGELLVDGGASTSYEVKCERDTSAYLSYREGWTYEGGKAITNPIDEFIADLALPGDAGRLLSSLSTRHPTRSCKPCWKQPLLGTARPFLNCSGSETLSISNRWTRS